jgi:hypothetical protein
MHGGLEQPHKIALAVFKLMKLVLYLFFLQDYMCKTPSWAVFGATERGFDPVERRWHRKTLTRKDISGC